MIPPTYDEICEISSGGYAPYDILRSVLHFTLTDTGAYDVMMIFAARTKTRTAHDALADTVRFFGERDGWRYASPAEPEAKNATAGTVEALADPSVQRPLTDAALAHYAELCERPERWYASHFAAALRETLAEIARLKAAPIALPDSLTDEQRAASRDGAEIARLKRACERERLNAEKIAAALDQEHAEHEATKAALAKVQDKCDAWAQPEEAAFMFAGS